MQERQWGDHELQDCEAESKVVCSNWRTQIPHFVDNLSNPRCAQVGARPVVQGTGRRFPSPPSRCPST